MIKKPAYALWTIGIITFIGYFLFGSSLPITDPVESNYAQTAKEMLESGSFISPLIYGHSWYDKPPMAYWGLIASFKIFGFHTLAARVPSALIAVASTVAMYASGKALYNNHSIALWSAIIVATTLEFWYISHGIITDGYLFLFSIGIFTCSYLAFTHKKRSYMRYAYGCAALAVLTKGPVGIVLPGAILLLYLIYKHEKKNLAILLDPIGILIFFGIATPWYYAMYNMHGIDFVKGFLGLHNVTRATVSEHPKQNVWYYYLVLTPFFLLPWLSYTIYGIKSGVLNKSLRVYSLLWAGFIILFYTIVATKYITYTFIALIPLVLLSAEGLYKLQIRPVHKRWQAILFLIPLLLLTLILVVVSYIEPHIAENNTLMLGLGTVITIGLLRFMVWGHPRLYPKVIAVFSALLLIFLPLIIEPIVRVHSSVDLIKTIEADAPDKVYFYETYLVSYTFYNGRKPIKIFDYNFNSPTIWSEGKNIMPSTTMANLDAGITSDNGPAMDRGVDTAIHKGDKAIIVVPKKYLEHYKTHAISKEFHEIGQYDKYFLMANYNPS